MKKSFGRNKKRPGTMSAGNRPSWSKWWTAGTVPPQDGSERRKGTVVLKKMIMVALFVVLNVLAIASVAAAEVSTLGPGPLSR